VPRTDRTLLDAVEEVASIADPTSPRTVSQRAFDEARSQSFLYPGLPRAKRIAERLGLKWAEVLEVAYSHGDKQNSLLYHKRKGSQAKWVTPENAAAALAVAARRLNKDSLTADEYRREREKMLAADAKRWMHGGQLRLPTEQQVSSVAGSWEKALRAAGLKTGGSKAHRRRRKRWIRRDCVSAVARYLTDEGRHATSTGYRSWRSQQQSAVPPFNTIISRYGWNDIEDDARNLLLEQELGVKRRP
jgi:hypothetical protein